MAIDSTGKIFTMADSNTETLGNLLKQLGGLLGVGKRSNGRYYLADMCQAVSINELSKYKPTDSKDIVNTENSHKGDGTQDGYFLGYDCYGVLKRYLTNTGFNAIGPNGTPNAGGAIRGVRFSDLEGEWSLAPLVHNRIRDFDGYSHVAAVNSWTQSIKPFIVSKSMLNPDGSISVTAALRYNWEDVIHADGKSATLGLKSLLACDGVNTKAYLGVVAYRTLEKSTGAGITLVPLAVARIHDTPLGERCSNTGEVNTHNVSLEIDDMIQGYDGSISSGHSYFYIGETGVKVLPFIAKWSGSAWYFVSLGVAPYAYPSGLAATGGSGSTTNTVVITKVTATLTAVKNTDGTITVGLQGNSAFQIVVTGSGFLAFQANNTFYIAPADGNSTMRSQTGVRLGISIDSDLDLPGTTVSAGTYQASSLMYGRSSSATYLNPPSSTFKPYSDSTPFKVGFQVAYYRHLKAWKYLTGSVEIDPSNLQSTYTITITGS